MALTWSRNQQYAPKIIFERSNIIQNFMIDWLIHTTTRNPMMKKTPKGFVHVTHSEEWKNKTFDFYFYSNKICDREKNY